MTNLVWLVLFTLTCHPPTAFGIRQNVNNIANLANDQVEQYGKTGKIAEMNIDANFDAEAVLSRKTREAKKKECDYRNITAALSDRPRKIREIYDESHSFYINPGANFGKIIFQMKLQNILDVTDMFYFEKSIELYSWDLNDEENKWTQINVQYYHHASRGPNSHALRVTVGNTTHSIVTSYWRLLYSYEGFLISTKGGVELLFHCSPENYLETLHPSIAWIWFLAGGLIIAMLLLGAMCCGVAGHHKKQEEQQDVSSQPNSLVYEEFDEEVLAKIREKVEALREGRVHEGNGSEVHNNHYVLQMVPLQQSSIPDTYIKHEEEEEEEEEEEGKEEQQQQQQQYEEDHYKVPRSIKKARHVPQNVCLPENKMSNDYSRDENPYDSLSSLNNSTPLNNENLKDQAINTTTLPQNVSTSTDVEDSRRSHEENPYENLYMAL